MKTNTVSIYPLFPYEKIEKGEEIILYGFGKIGKRYLAQIEETGYCKVKYIIDRNASAYSVFRIPVYPVEALRGTEKAPALLELSFVRNGLYQMEEAKELGLPLELDRACLKEFPDILMNLWNDEWE